MFVKGRLRGRDVVTVDNVIDFVTEDGVIISVEALPVRRVGVSGVSRGPFPPDGERKFDEIIDRIRKVAEAVSAQLGKLEESALMPDETQVEFGVSVSAEADVLIVKGGGESSFTVTMTWRHGP
jgi:hypothetical protein